MDRRTLLELSDLNLAEATREMARWSSRASLREQDDLLLVAGPDDFPVGYGNAALPCGPGPCDPPAALAAARTFFGERGRGYTVWTRDHLDSGLAEACAQAGLRPFADMPGMVLEPGPGQAAAAPPGCRLRPVDGEAAVREFAEVCARAYGPLGMPEASLRAVFAEPARLLRPHVLGVLGEGPEGPLAAALAILSHGIGGLYWVGTAPEARRRGLGEACTRAAGQACFERGAAAVVLQASQQGEPIYRRMGYQELTRYRWHLELP